MTMHRILAMGMPIEMFFVLNLLLLLNYFNFFVVFSFLTILIDVHTATYVY